MTTNVLSSGAPHSMIATTPHSHRSDAVNLSSSPLPSPSQLLGVPSQSMINGSDTLEAAAEVLKFADASALVQYAKCLEREPSLYSDQMGLEERHHLPPRSNVSWQPVESHEKEKNASPVFKRPPSIHVDIDVIEKPDSVTTLSLPTSEIKPLDEPLEKKGRKKIRKSGGEAKRQAKIKKPRITKLGALNDLTKTKNTTSSKRAKEDRSPERLLRDVLAKRRNKYVPAEHAELGLEEAVRRRIDWTPIRDTVAVRSDASPKDPESKSIETPNTVVKRTSSFIGLAQDYGFSDQQGQGFLGTSDLRVTADTVTAKKRRVELVYGVSTAASTVKRAKKARTPPKKLQTITSKATEDFIHIDEDKAIYILSEGLTPDQNPASVKQIKRKSKKANDSSKAKTKEDVQSAPVVLSPETAMKSTRDQDFVFGTSSQLVRGASPISADGYQQAVGKIGSNSSTNLRSVFSSTHLQRPTLLGLSPSRNLWSAAARHSEAEIADVEQTEETPTANASNASPFLDKNTANPDDSASREQDIWHDITPISSPPKQPDHHSKRIVEEPDTEISQSLPRSVAEKVLKSRPALMPSKKKVSTSDPSVNPKPNYQGFSDTELKKLIKSYGFKAVSRRNAMISLLEKCWESKASHVFQELPSNAPTRQPDKGAVSGEVNQPAASKKTKAGSPVKKQSRATKSTLVEELQHTPAEIQPKKARGRPKKSSSVTTTTTTTTPPPAKKKRKSPAKTKASKTTSADIGDEIYDSSPPTPSPPRRCTSSKPAKNSLALSPGAKNCAGSKTTNTPPSLTANDDSNPEGPSHLFAAITQAVKSQPPTHDIKNPSWHEKMLMYDPIVIEDLTSWLNTEGLGRIGEDDEVELGIVKAWCESRSVCCLWMENLRGGARGRW